MKKFVYALAAAALFTGCVKEGAHEFDNPGNDQIRFSTGTSVETRAAVEGEGFTGTEKIGIFALAHSGTMAWPIAIGGFHMQNVKGTAGNGKNAAVSNLTGSPHIWPANQLNFYAYHPHIDESSGGITSITYDPTYGPILNINNTTVYSNDYMWAAPEVNKTKALNGSAAIPLAFKHALSLVRVMVKLGSNMPATASLTSLTLITDASTSNQIGTINVATGINNFTAIGSVTYTRSGLTATVNNTAAVDAEKFIFVPATKITKLKATVGGVEYEATTDITTQGVGGATDITVTINPNEISFTTSVTKWIEPAATVPVTAQ